MEYNTIMETGIIKKMLIALAVIIGVIAISYLIGLRDGQNQSVEGSNVKIDTLYIRDTITQYEPIYKEKIKLEKILVSVENTDTLWKHDTMYVYLPKEQIIWKDDYSSIYVSGFRPSLDSVKHYVTTQIVTKELTKVIKKPCRWGIGVQVGYGAYFGSQIHAAPYIGVGLSYNLLSW